MDTSLLNKKLSVLLLEDNPHDAVLIEELLKSEGFDLLLYRVDTELNFKKYLSETTPDLIISDFSLPSYNGKAALKLAQTLKPETPFIFFSGTIGEESAIEALKQGATDYVLKQRPQRLVAALRRALEDKVQRDRHTAAEQKIKAQARLIDLASDAIVTLDQEGVVTFWNAGAARLYGFSAEEAENKSYPQLLFGKSIEEFDAARKGTQQNGQWTGEMEHLAKDNRKILVSSRWTLIAEGDEDRFLTICTDITERKQFESQFLRAQRLESIGTLASGIAHDLNNVLAPICMASELLRAGDLDRSELALVSTIEQSARRGADIVKQILTFVRGSDGKRAPLALGILIKEIAKVSSQTMPKNIQVRFSIADGLWTVKGDPSQLHQVLLNLCVNARDAMPSGGTLSINAENVQTASEVLLEVRDTGTGIPGEVMDKIFDPFFTTKEAGKGTGLGLSTVSGIVKSHGGRIEVESICGKGTAFRIFLPADDSATLPNSVEQLDIPRGNGELVLVVEDEEEIRTLTSQTLQRWGYEVVTAANGSEGMLRFAEKKETVSIVVADMMMAGVDGASLAKILRTFRRDVKIILTSGQPETLGIPDADALLRKPYPGKDLLKCLADLLIQNSPSSSRSQ